MPTQLHRLLAGKLIHSGDDKNLRAIKWCLSKSKRQKSGATFQRLLALRGPEQYGQEITGD